MTPQHVAEASDTIESLAITESPRARGTYAIGALSVVGPVGNPPNTLSDLTIGSDVMASPVDITALVGGVAR